MITISERCTEKVTGDTAFFVKFNYNADIVAFIKTLSGSNYNKATKEWEVPLPYLSSLIDTLCLYDDIELNLIDTHTQINSDSVDDCTLDTYKYAPFQYQEDGIKYGLSTDKWLLLFDMGLGKTLVIIYLANELRRRGEIDHCLVICGVNSLKSNWQKEIKKFTDLDSVILGERTTKTGRKVIGTVKERIAHLNRPINEFFVITNIETLRNEEVTDAILNGPNKFDMIAVDEIHKCSADQSSQQAQGLLRLTKAKYRIGMTGTLITNNPLNAYVPLKWIGVERGTYTNFTKFYVEFGELPFNNAKNSKFHTIITGTKNLSYLKYLISNHSLRKTKDVLGLPPKVVINEYVEMDEKQSQFYDNIKAGVKDQVDKVKLNSSNILTLVTRLRQATACPSFLTTEKIPSAKVDRAVDLATQLINSGEKVVIFSTFKETVSVLSNRLSEFKPLTATGDLGDDVVSNNVDQFQTNPDKKLFIATWQRCGTGFTLTASRYLIFIDIPFTNASYEQAQDRIYRIGTKESVFIYHLITTDTVDERVLSIVENKKVVGDYLVDGTVNGAITQELSNFLYNL